MHYVIGTGPTAIAAATAIAKRGRPVTIVDSSVRPDDKTIALQRKLGSTQPSGWDPADVAQLANGNVVTASGIPMKRVFGSDHVYRGLDVAPEHLLDGATVSRSFARGGLSNVWGSCILPYPDSELAGWPFPAQDLRPHYSAVLDFLPHAGQHDELSKLFPVFDERQQDNALTSQARSLLGDLDRKKASLRERGISYGGAKLAVDIEGRNWGEPCRKCGKCLYGCPYGLIYSAEKTLQQLRQLPHVKYLPDRWVQKIVADDGTLSVVMRDTQNGQRIVEDAGKVYLGAGVVETTRIILASLERYARPVRGLSSDRFVMPFFRFGASKGISDEALNTLCQLFVEIEDPEVCDRIVHLQLYGYNDMMNDVISLKLGGLSKLIGQRLRRPVLERAMVAFGYLHSDYSSSLEYMLAESGELKIRGIPSKTAESLSRKVANKLRTAGVGIKTIFGAAKLDPPGGGNHSGGIFPMSKNPTDIQSDAAGCLPGLPNLHIVDASVLPSLSATTITLPAMANAHRIASISC